MTQIINLTPHDINILDDFGNVTHTFPKSGQVVRLDVSTTAVDNDGIPTVKRQVNLDVSHVTEWSDDAWDSQVPVGGYSLISGISIPDESDILVSAQVASFLATKGETPFRIFTVGDTVKDSNGAIIGTKFLVLN